MIYGFSVLNCKQKLSTYSYFRRIEIPAPVDNDHEQERKLNQSCADRFKLIQVKTQQQQARQ